MIKDWVRLIKVLKYYTQDTIFLSKLPQNKFIDSDEVLIIKTDAIGDYILFRNFLKYFN